MMQSKPHTTSNSQKMAELQATKNVDRKWSGSCYTETETAVVVVRPDGVEALQTVAVVPARLVDTHRVTPAGRDAEGTLVYVCKRAPNAIGGSQHGTAIAGSCQEGTTNSRELSRGHHKRQESCQEGTKNNRTPSRGHQTQQGVVKTVPKQQEVVKRAPKNNRTSSRGHQTQQGFVKRVPQNNRKLL